eukprot:3676569-Prymnesium_polylepis.1
MYVLVESQSSGGLIPMPPPQPMNIVWPTCGARGVRASARVRGESITHACATRAGVRACGRLTC